MAINDRASASLFGLESFQGLRVNRRAIHLRKLFTVFVRDFSGQLVDELGVVNPAIFPEREDSEDGFLRLLGCVLAADDASQRAWEDLLEAAAQVYVLLNEVIH